MLPPNKLSRVTGSWNDNMHFGNTKQQNTTKKQGRSLAAIVAHLKIFKDELLPAIDLFYELAYIVKVFMSALQTSWVRQVSIMHSCRQGLPDEQVHGIQLKLHVSC